MKMKDIPIETSPDRPRGTVGFISPATLDEIERGEAVRVPGTDLWIHPRRCGVITDIGDAKP